MDFRGSKFKLWNIGKVLVGSDLRCPDGDLLDLCSQFCLSRPSIRLCDREKKRIKELYGYITFAGVGVDWGSNNNRILF